MTRWGNIRGGVVASEEVESTYNDSPGKKKKIMVRRKCSRRRDLGNRVSKNDAVRSDLCGAPR